MESGLCLRGLSLNPQMNLSYEPAIRLMVADFENPNANGGNEEEDQVWKSSKQRGFCLGLRESVSFETTCRCKTPSN